MYPIAQTTEMQDMLVQQLKLIKQLYFYKLRFIFIIDELDKVSPEDNEKQALPEYNFTNVVNGNSTYRSRQKALASLLANMKYFISSSEAKFVFITGYGQDCLLGSFFYPFGRSARYMEIELAREETSLCRVSILSPAAVIVE